jgi:protein SCO1
MKHLFIALILFSISACQLGFTDGSSELLKDEEKLPYFGLHDLDENGDTIYYTVPKFSFINQNGREVSHYDYQGKIFVTDFFFTTCPTICPIMSTQMSRLQTLLEKDGILGDVMLLSHTINPEYDQPEVLKAYAERMEADTNTWNFVTGPRADIYFQAKQGYFVNALQSDTADGGYIHSDNFMLIDREMHIRGYYDGTSTKEVDQLFLDIKSLMQE